VNVLLIQIDGKLPNLALMRIAAHHHQHGDSVELRRGADFGGLFDEPFDRVYASTIFESSRPLAYRVLATYPDAIVGGTGWDLVRRLDDIGVTTGNLDYSIYPEYRRSIGFAMRGCRLQCPFCVVPTKEGAPARRVPSRKSGVAIRGPVKWCCSITISLAIRSGAPASRRCAMAGSRSASRRESTPAS